MRLDQITFTRFLAAIAIVVFHFGDDIAPFSWKPIAFLFREGNIGVSYFFILSGFIMIISYADKGAIAAVDYYKKRFARIYPVYLLAIIVYAAWFLYAGAGIDYPGLVLNLLVIQSWWPRYALSFNGPGWSLAVEALFYGLFPLLFNTYYRKLPWTKLWLPVIAIWAITQLILVVGLHTRYYSSDHMTGYALFYYFPLMHLNQFLVGNLAGRYFLSAKDRLTRNHDLAILALLALCSLLLKYPVDRFEPGITYHDGLMAVIFVPFILLMSANTGLITRLFRARPLILLGEISYGIYILQRPVFLWSRQLVAYFWIDDPALKFYGYLVLLLLVSVLSYYLVEVPLRKMIVGSNKGKNKVLE